MASIHPEMLESTKSPPFTPEKTVPLKTSVSPTRLQTEPSGSRSKQESTNLETSQSLTAPTTPKEDTSETETFSLRSFYKKPFVYGEIDLELNGRAKFIKVNNPEIGKSNLLKRLAEEVLNEYPHPEKKRLLLSITDGAEKLGDVESKTFKDSLKKILPGTCLVTGGTNTGVTKLVGECVRDFNDSVRGKNDTCLAIGIINLGHNNNTGLLQEEKRFGIDDDGTIFLVDFSGKRWTFNQAVLPKYCNTTTTNVPKCERNKDIGTDGSSPVKEGDGTDGSSPVKEGDGTDSSLPLKEGDGTDGPSQVKEGDGADGSSSVKEGDGTDGSSSAKEGEGSDSSSQLKEGDGTDGSSPIKEGDGTEGSSPFTFKKGDIVKIEKISSNQKTSQNLKGIMIEQTIGKIGTVITVDTNLDLQIQVCGTKWHYQPHDVTFLSPKKLNKQLKKWLKNHVHMQNPLVNFVLSGEADEMKDQLHKAIRNQKPTRVGIDYNGDLYVKDGEGKREIIQLDERTDVNASDVYYMKDTEITTKAGSSDDKHFAVDDLVQICNHTAQHTNKHNIDWRIHFDRTYGKIGTVLKVKKNYLLINVCGSKERYRSQDVAQVSFDSLTSHLKKWFQTHTPIDEMDDMVKAVLSDNVRQVRKLLRRVKKNKEMFGVDKEGFLFVVDVNGKRIFNVVGGSISPPFVDGDIVMICSNEHTLKDLQNGQWRTGMDRTIGKIGTVMEVHNNIEMRIKVCGVEWWYRPQVVGLVSLERLTMRLKKSLKNVQPENDTLLNAVMSGDARSVGKQLSSSLRAQVVFGLDEGDIFGIDVSGQRHTIDVEGKHVSPTYKKGDLVQICNDPTRLKNLQDKLWQDGMKETVDRIGLVKEVETNHDLRVGNWPWKYRPYAVKQVSLATVTRHIKEWVETYMPENENDEMRKAVMSKDVERVRGILSSDANDQDQRVFGLDKGRLFIMDIDDERRFFTVDGGSIHPRFVKSDIVQICRDKVPREIAIVVEDDPTNELVINLCGAETIFNRQDVDLVPLKQLTCELKMWFEMYIPKTEKDAMTEAVMSKKATEVGKLLSHNKKGPQRVCGIDTDGFLYIKDTSGKRRKFLLDGGTISPTFFEGDIVHICSEAKLNEQKLNEQMSLWKDDIKQTLDKIGTILEVTPESKLRIKVGADTFIYWPPYVTLVPMVHLTRKFKEWIEHHWPQLENQTFGKAVLEGNADEVRKALTNSQKDQHLGNGVFGIDEEGDVYVMDIYNKRHKLRKASQMDATRFYAGGFNMKPIGKDDLVRISNDQSLIVVLQDNSDDVDTKKILGKFGTVLRVKEENALLIEVCGLTLHCSKNSVVKVSLEDLTCKLKVWFDNHWPKLDDFGRDVLT
ncbi:uncharacterized protein LOC127850877 [Dreissena polymorpha]|uniref:uncharacterized protein LOC127850877 n=1 Tax=Dreissena polymorpha TaxID=45954 RepID=UPI002263FCF6|nr:uncharacterized protein LOC127850877 [Dreissena polymorpha]